MKGLEGVCAHIVKPCVAMHAGDPQNTNFLFPLRSDAQYDGDRIIGAHVCVYYQIFFRHLLPKIAIHNSYNFVRYLQATNLQGRPNSKVRLQRLSDDRRGKRKIFCARNLVIQSFYRQRR